MCVTIATGGAGWGIKYGNFVGMAIIKKSTQAFFGTYLGPTQ
jgi:hypothetical protein